VALDDGQMQPPAWQYISMICLTATLSLSIFHSKPLENIAKRMVKNISSAKIDFFLNKSAKVDWHGVSLLYIEAVFLLVFWNQITRYSLLSIPTNKL